MIIPGKQIFLLHDYLVILVFSYDWSINLNKYIRLWFLIYILSILLWLIYQPKQIFLLYDYWLVFLVFSYDWSINLYKYDCWLLRYSMVQLVLLPHGIAPTFLKLDSWSPVADFNAYYIHQGNKSDMHTKKNNTFLKDGCNSLWVQFHVYRIVSVIFKDLSNIYL